MGEGGKRKGFGAYISLGLGWFFGVPVLLLAVAMLFNIKGGNMLTSIPMLFLAFLLLPPFKRFLKISGKAKTFMVVAALFCIGIISTQEEEINKKRAAVVEFQKNKGTIIQEIEDVINQGRFTEAGSLAEEKLAIVPKDQELIELKKQAVEGKALLEIKSLHPDNLARHLELYQELATLRPDSKTYADRLEFYKEKFKEETERAEEKATRKKLIEEQFSSWDGSHLALTRYIKNHMNDPKSYQHVETRYGDRGDFIMITTKFRGKNAFGGVVVQTATAMATIDGDLISVSFN